MYLRSAKSRLLDRSDSLVQFLSFFILLIFFDSLYILDSVVILLIIHKITLLCVGFIRYIAVVTVVIIVDLYNLFRSL